MTGSPLVSVLMPVYNGEQYLRPAIDSILSQTFTDFEFIIINDGSSDSSESIVKSYNDARIRYVKNEKNIKLIATLNKGLKLCRGKYIARMDADDISYPERFAKQVAFMEANPEYGLCGTNIDIDERFRSWVRMGEDLIRFCLLFHNPVCHPTAFLRTSIIRDYQLEYPAEYIHAEEYILWLNILKHSKVINLDEKLLFYRLHDGQVSHVFKEEQFKVGERIRLELFEDLVIVAPTRAKKAHLVLAGMTTRALQKQKFEEIEYRFTSGVTRGQLKSWLFWMKFSVLFRNKWDNKYLRSFISKVEDGVKKAQWPSLRYRIADFRNRLRNKSRASQ